MDLFKVPSGGWRDESAKYYNIERALTAVLWSSSPYLNSDPYAISLDMIRVSTNRNVIFLNTGDYRSDADSVRCFKNPSPEPSMTIHPNG
jgi:hypothetical protein